MLLVEHELVMGASIVTKRLKFFRCEAQRKKWG